MHFIGTASNPLWIGKKKDVPGLLTGRFWDIFDVWRKFNLGLGLPASCAELDQDLVDIIADFEHHYQIYFSQYASMMKVFEGIIERQNVANKQLNTIIKGLPRRR